MTDDPSAVNDRFRFLRDDLQQKLLDLVIAMNLDHQIEDGLLCTREKDEMTVEDLRSAVRSTLFDDWHLWRGTAAKNPQMYGQYCAYMNEHDIRYVEEQDNGSRWFQLSKDDDPYRWGVEEFKSP